MNALIALVPGMHGVPLYLFLEFVPITTFYLAVLFFQIMQYDLISYDLLCDVQSNIRVLSHMATKLAIIIICF